MSLEKHYNKELTPDEMKKINDLEVEQGIKDTSILDDYSAKVSLAKQVNDFDKKNEGIEEIKKEVNQYEGEKRKKLEELYLEFQDVSTKEFDVSQELEKYFGEMEKNKQLQFLNEKDAEDYAELKKEQAEYQNELEKINIEINLLKNNYQN